MSEITDQKTCPLWGRCLYPHTKSRHFTEGNAPCNNGSRCEVEIAVQQAQESSTSELVRVIDPLTPQSHWVAVFEDAEQWERNTARGLPWQCDCKLCQCGKWTECYQKNGPDRALRQLIGSGSYVAPWAKTQPAATLVSDTEARAP